ncbi:MAG: UDP-N-acetylglucosamine 2-epimerase (non-hydrolyzing) [Bacteroidota bacterium]
MKVLSVVGARPNFMKIAPVHQALLEVGGINSRIVHTGQHYDEKMSDIFFRQLGLPEPHVYLDVHSGSHAEQTGRVMMAFERVVWAEEPDLIIVVGDVNSTLACGLVAAKLHVPLAHVEAGLRSHDRRMPEEINRMVTDRISDHLFVTEQSGIQHLKAEGVPDERVHFVGNVMIDTLLRFRDQAARSDLRNQYSLCQGSYVLVTMHRPSNVDIPEHLEAVVKALELVAQDHPVVFPVHPRTRKYLAQGGGLGRLERHQSIFLMEPVGYVEFVHLMEGAGLVMTDSGGVQEETTVLGVPCLTVRPHTERPVTVDHGTNELIERDPQAIHARVRERMTAPRSNPVMPPLWDGRASHRIARIVAGLS